MGASLGISLWVTLATIVPGLITIAALYGAVVFVFPDFIKDHLGGIGSCGDWPMAGMAITIMILTQALGILLENILIKLKALGPEHEIIWIPPGIDPLGSNKFILKRYDEYSGFYILIAEFEESEGVKQHLERVLAQFFLTNNTLVSFSGALIFSVLLAFLYPQAWGSPKFYVYLSSVFLALIVSWKVARIRFTAMTMFLWAVRRKKMKTSKKRREKGRALT